MMPNPSSQRDKIVEGTLSFVGGFVDTATFVAIVGLFSGHVTGNLILFASSMSTGVEPKDYLKLLVFPFFVLGVATATLLHDRWKRHAVPHPQKRIMAIMTAILGACTVASYWVLPETTHPEAVTFLQGTLAMAIVFAMGFHNAHDQLKGKSRGMTTVMTGNVTKITVESVRGWRDRRTAPDHVPEHQKKAKDIGFLILCFFIGCAASAFLTLRWGLVSMAIPTILLSLSLLLFKEENPSKSSLL